MLPFLLSFAVVVGSDPYTFLTGHGTTIDGSALQAIQVAMQREHISNAMLLDRAVVSERAAVGFVVSFVPFDAAAQQPVQSATVAGSDIAEPPRPPNSKLIAPLEPSPHLLGTDVAALLAAYAQWRLYEHEIGWDFGPLAAYAVSLQQYVYAGRLSYGVSFTRKWWVFGTLGCDYETRISPRTFVPLQRFTKIC